MSKQLKNIPHLDALRFLSALMVVCHHYLTELKFKWEFPMGFYGVQIFFAISGFLITSILLKQKNAIQLGQKKRLVVRNFFIKRVLRLFPAYYLLVLFYIILQHYGMSIAQPGWIPYFVCYMPNIFFYFNGWQETIVNHLWSLGIEEQFYLLWPFIILLLPRRNEFKLILILILTGYFVKCFLFYRDPSMLPHGQYDPFLLPIGQFDTIGVGALFACAIEYNMKLLEFLKKIIGWFLPAMILLTIFVSIDKTRNDPYLCLCLFFLSGALVYKSHLGFGGFIKKIFENRLVLYGGKISYGIYLFHKVIPTLLQSFFKFLNLARPATSVIFTCSLLLTFLIAHLSWVFLEKRMVTLKDRFDL